MKKIKEINLNVDTSRYSSPHVKGKQPYFSGYGGGMTDSAASSTSSLMNSKKFTDDDTVEDFDEEEEQGSNLMPENILHARVRKEKGYSLQETLQVLNEFLDTKSLEVLDEMEDEHKKLIGNVIDSMQSIYMLMPVNIPLPGISTGVDVAKAATGFTTAQALQFGAGNTISKLGQVLATTRSDDRSSIVSSFSEISPFLLALPKILTNLKNPITRPIMAIVNKVVFDALECIGKLGLILEKSPTTKNSMYTYSAMDVASELFGDALPSAVEASDPSEIIDGLFGAVRLAKNLVELWYGSKKGNELIDDYLKRNPGALSSEPIQTAQPIEDEQPNLEKIPSKPGNQIKDLLGDQITKAVQAQISSLGLPGLNEDSYYGIDEEDESEEDRKDSEVDEMGYVLPLGKSNKPSSEANDHVRLFEELRAIQNWKHRTSGKIK